MKAIKGVAPSPSTVSAPPPSGSALLKGLTFLMFMMFAMTTDSVGVIIPQIIRQFSLGMTAAGSFQYATMAGISLAALTLGFLADKLGRKAAIILGLVLFAGSSAAFALGGSFAAFVALLFVGGVGIGVFKAGALALISDLSRSTREHTSTMNAVEGFFGVGAIIGPAIVAALLRGGASWRWLYVIAAGVCSLLIFAAALARYPARGEAATQAAGPREILSVLKDPYALAFGLAAMLYVGAEAGVYVWGPTYLAGYRGPLASGAALMVPTFFVLRALGRFAGAQALERVNWAVALTIATLAMTALFAVSVFGGRGAAVIALPLAGLFMSVVYPTLNSKGISCFERARHGAAAGVLLFFTCFGAIVMPLLMAFASDLGHDAAYSLILAAAFSALLAAMAVLNLLAKPTAARLALRDLEDYRT